MCVCAAESAETGAVLMGSGVIIGLVQLALPVLVGIMGKQVVCFLVTLAHAFCGPPQGRLAGLYLCRRAHCVT